MFKSEDNTGSGWKTADSDSAVCVSVSEKWSWCWTRHNKPVTTIWTETQYYSYSYLSKVSWSTWADWHAAEKLTTYPNSQWELPDTRQIQTLNNSLMVMMVNQFTWAIKSNNLWTNQSLSWSEAFQVLIWCKLTLEQFYCQLSKW